MAKRGRPAYTDIGRRIAVLAKGQEEIADVLGVKASAVLEKLRDLRSIRVSELLKLSAYYGVPPAYFFSKASPKISAACERVEAGPAVLQKMVAELSKLPAEVLERIYPLVRLAARSAKAKR